MTLARTETLVVIQLGVSLKLCLQKIITTLSCLVMNLKIRDQYSILPQVI